VTLTTHGVEVAVDRKLRVARCLQGGVAGGRGQCLLTARHSRAAALAPVVEPGEVEQRPGAQPARAFGDGKNDGARTLRVARLDEVVAKLECAPVSVVEGVRRSQPNRQLGELDGGLRRAAPPNLAGCFTDGKRHSSVRFIRAERQMPCALLRARGERCKLPMRSPSLLIRNGGIDRRGKQWVLEAHRLTLDGYPPRRLCAAEPGLDLLRRRPHRVPQRVDRRARHRGRKEEHLPGRSWQKPQPARNQLAHVVRNRKRLSRRRRSGPQKRRRQLEREQRVAGRRTVNAKKRSPTERPTQPRLDQLVQRPGAQRADPNHLESLVQRTVETQRHQAATTAQRKEETDGKTPESPSRELQHPSRGTVEPLDVIHRDDDRRPGGQLSQHRHRRHRDRTRTSDRVTAACSQQRNLERFPLRRCECRKDLRLDPRQQVGQRRVRKRRLRLRRRTRQHRKRSCPRASDAFPPQGGLADPSLTLKHERGRTLRQRIEETADDPQLFLPAQKLSHDPRVGASTTFRNQCALQSPLTDSDRRLPTYHGLG